MSPCLHALLSPTGTNVGKGKLSQNFSWTFLEPENSPVAFAGVRGAVPLEQHRRSRNFSQKIHFHAWVDETEFTSFNHD